MSIRQDASAGNRGPGPRPGNGLLPGPAMMESRARNGPNYGMDKTTALVENYRDLPKDPPMTSSSAQIIDLSAYRARRNPAPPAAAKPVFYWLFMPVMMMPICVMMPMPGVSSGR